MRAFLALILLLIAAPLAAQDSEEFVDGPFDQRQFTCPLGGESFTQDVGYSSFPLETLPDGSWLGDIAIDAQIPVCPGNGLVILPDYGAMQQQQADRMAYRSYTDTELAQLPGLIANPEYAALEAEGRHMQAYWLATRLGLPAIDRFHLLQRATWAALASELRRKLVTKLVTDGPSLIDASGLAEQQQRAARFYVVNGLRELGRFDEALALLEKIEASGPPVAAPVDPDDIFVDEWAPEVRLAIEERDDGRFPIELLSQRMVVQICGGDVIPPYDQRNLAACDAHREREAREASETEKTFDEAYALRDDVPALQRQCGETAPDARGKALAMACDSLQEANDERAAAELLKDGTALAASCVATPEKDQHGPLFYACNSFSTALESALGKALARDDAAWTILCPEGDSEAEVEDRNFHISAACSSAAAERSEMAQAALLADPVTLDAQCANTPEDELHMPLFGACLDRKGQLRAAAIELRASDPSEFDRSCARYGRTNKAGNDVYDLTDEQEMCRNAWRLRENRKTKAAAEARGLKCFSDVIYSPDRPSCVTPAEYEREFNIGRRGDVFDDIRDDRFEEDSSLSRAARDHAATIIAAAYASGTYPRKMPGDRF